MGTITILRSNLLIACIIQENQNLLDESRKGRQNRSLVSLAAQTSESVCDAKRRCDGMDEACCLQQAEGYGVHIDEGQAIKSARGMPWHQEPTKDVTSCDKLRGGANIR